MNSPAISKFRLKSVDTANRAEVLPLGRQHALQSAGEAFHALADTMPQLVWSTLPDGSHDYYNARWYEFTGAPVGSTDGEGWAGMFHEEDQPNAWEVWNRSLETGEPYEVEYRLRHHSGQYRWMLGRALPVVDDDGVIQRWIGTCTDIEETKRVALENEILSQELSHRIKNIFAIISSLVSLTARASDAFGDRAGELLGRIRALGRAHEIVRPHTEKSRPEIGDVTLSALLETIFDAYPAWSEGRIEVTGGDLLIGSKAATPVALIFHELATNAMKYGALSSADGRVRLELTEGDETVGLRWVETGGPPAPTEEPASGFGSRLIDLAIRQQLGGSYERLRTDDGLEIDMDVQRQRLVENA
ncbi:PAS domain-containing protein [Qipengyuania sp. JC766]|uniref:sensor histidine kinase n=1 Tax=Qipengyuania sp. JC766 TaxID=3232139 RepID=UPI003459ECD6